jgi:hypothetical protein
MRRAWFGLKCEAPWALNTFDGSRVAGLREGLAGGAPEPNVRPTFDASIVA